MFTFTKCTEEEYFTKPAYLGSTEYSLLMTEGIAALAERFLSQKKTKKSHALVFGDLFHKCLEGAINLEDFSEDSLAQTKDDYMETGLIGGHDFYVLKTLLEKFPLDFNLIRANSKFYAHEDGYFIEGAGELEKLTFRLKPDLTFFLHGHKELIVVDWKTTSRFSKGANFIKKYRHQANFYGYFLSKLHNVENIRHILVWFSKDEPFEIFTETISLHRFDLHDNLFLDYFRTMHKIRLKPQKYRRKNVEISDSLLSVFTKTF